MATAYSQMSREELEKELAEKRRQLREFRFDIAGTKTRNVKEGQHTRREIARILTELNKPSTSYEQ